MQGTTADKNIIEKLRAEVQRLQIDAASKLSATSTAHIELVARVEKLESDVSDTRTKIAADTNIRLARLEVKMNILAYVAGATLLSVLGLIFSIVGHAL